MSLAAIRDEMAREHVLADVETFSDELAGECMRMPRVTSAYECRNQTRLQAAAMPVVLHALLLAGQRGDGETAAVCAKILGDRYLLAEAERVRRRVEMLEREAEAEALS